MAVISRGDVDLAGLASVVHQMVAQPEDTGQEWLEEQIRVRGLAPHEAEALRGLRLRMESGELHLGDDLQWR